MNQVNVHGHWGLGMEERDGTFHFFDGCKKIRYVCERQRFRQCPSPLITIDSALTVFSAAAGDGGGPVAVWWQTSGHCPALKLWAESGGWRDDNKPCVKQWFPPSR